MRLERRVQLHGNADLYRGIGLFASRLRRSVIASVGSSMLCNPVGPLVASSTRRGFLPRGLSNAGPHATAGAAMPRLTGRHRIALSDGACVASPAADTRRAV